MDTVLKWGNPLDKPYPLFLLGLGVITSYIPGIVGGAIPTGWLFLCLVVPLLMFYSDLKLGLGFVFICYAAFSLLWSASINISLFYFAQIVIAGCLFIIGQNIKDLKPVFIGLSVGLGLASIVAFLQYSGNHSVYSLDNAVAGLFINPNIYSEISAILLVSLAVFKLWFWIPVTLPGLIMVPSRAALLALFSGIFVILWGYSKKLALLSVAVAICVGLYLYYGRFSFASVSERFNLWADTIQGFKLFGNGVGSYEIMFPAYATHINTELSRPKFAHNDILQLFFEFGIGSIFILMVILNVFNSKRKEVTILFSIFIISLFTYPLHMPTTTFIAFLVAGYITANTTSYGDIWVNWRSILFKRDLQPRYS